MNEVDYLLQFAFKVGQYEIFHCVPYKPYCVYAHPKSASDPNPRASCTVASMSAIASAASIAASSVSLIA